jgi:tetratricopeptide (TPR) repeat protein
MMFYNNTRKLCVVASLSLFTFLISGCGMWRDFTTYFNTYYNAKTLFDRTEEEIQKQKKDIFVFRGDITGSTASRTGSSSLGVNQAGGLSQGNFQAGDQNTNNNSNLGTNQFGNQSSDQLGSQTTNQFGNQTTNQLGSQTTSQFGNQTTNQFGNQTTSQFGNQSANSFGSQSSTSSYGTSSSLSTGQFNQDLTKVIEKCSKILQYEKESSYFPDALFMTGKAFYYQNEYARAQRKFIELSGLGDTKYSLESNLWLAKTYLQLRGFEEGLRLLEEVKAQAIKNGKDELFIDASVTKISFFIFREEFSKAVEECKNFLAVSPDDETSALVSNQLGKIYLQIKDYNNALEAFASVSKYSPSFDIEFSSRLEHAKLLKVLKRDDESEAELNKLRTTGRYRNNLDQILIELGQIYYEKDRLIPAIEIFKDVDSTYRGKRTSAIADVKLGEIYEKKYRDYDSSYKYYIKSISLLGDKDLQTLTNNKVKTIDKYRQLKLSLANDYVDLMYVQDSVRFYRDSSDYDFAYKQYAEENKRLIDQQTNTGQGQLRDNQNQNQQQLLQQQQAQAQAQQKLASVKNEKDLTASQRIALGKLKKPVRPKISADSISTLISIDLYKIGNLFYSELEVPDSTFYYFSKVLNEYRSKPIVANTMYALGTFYETHNDSVKADSIFRYINDNFDKSDVKKSVMQKLGLIKKDDSKEKPDTDPAKIVYLEGEKNYYDKKFNEAIELFKKIYNEYPLSTYAPKSVYYVGMIYENNLKMYDSAAVTYGRLIKGFQKDPLVNIVAAKVQFYVSEKEKDKKEAEQKAKEASDKEKAEEELKTETKLPATEQGGKPNTPKIIPTASNNTVKDSMKTESVSKQKLLEREEMKKPVVPDSTKKKRELIE